MSETTTPKLLADLDPRRTRRFVPVNFAQRRSGVALIMVLLVLSALAIVGTPFVISMALQEKSSVRFEGAVKARVAAEAARNHAMSILQRTHLAVEDEKEAEEAGVLEELEQERSRSTRTSRNRSTRTSRNRRSSTRRRGRGVVIREDLGEKSEKVRRDGLRSIGVSGMFTSKKGPRQKSFDEASDYESRLPAELNLPSRAPRLTVHADLAGALVAVFLRCGGRG